MAIDIYEGRTKRLSIPEHVLAHLDDTQTELRTRTGRGIDCYATRTLEPEHAAIWLSGLRRVLPTLRHDAQMRQACEELISLLARAVDEKRTLLVEGE